ncbi:MAG: hypothetical protein KBC11_00260 [Candidatus Pacebacteria bacterium]|nr:hypothetical protein [Candidatus Paceibacterota bacterium]
MVKTAQSTQFLKVLMEENVFKDTTLTPSNYEHVVLTKKNHEDGLDLMTAWDGDYHHAEAQNVFLGHWVEQK